MYIETTYKGQVGEAWVVFDVTRDKATARIATFDGEADDFDDDNPVFVKVGQDARVDAACARLVRADVAHKWTIAVCECGDACCTVAWSGDATVEWDGTFTGPDTLRDEGARVWRAVRACYLHVS